MVIPIELQPAKEGDGSGLANPEPRLSKREQDYVDMMEYQIEQEERENVSESIGEGFELLYGLSL